jgi:hypothetical protein
MRSDRKQQGKENRRFLCDTVVNRFGGVYKDFLSWETSKRKKNGVRKVSQVGTIHLGAPGLPGVPWCLVPARVRFLEVSYFPNFLNLPKLTKNIFADFLESVYLLYNIPPLF